VVFARKDMIEPHRTEIVADGLQGVSSQARRFAGRVICSLLKRHLLS